MKKQLSLVLPSLLGLTLIASPMAHAAATADATAACNLAIGEGDVSKALAFAEQALKTDGKSFDALLCKGRALGTIGHNQEALSVLETANPLATTPLNRMTVLSLIGNVQKNEKQYDQAQANYEQSLKIARAESNTRFERVNLNLIAGSLVEQGQLDAGLENYLAGSKLSANDNERADSFTRIAATYSQLGKHAQAIEYQHKVLLMEESAGERDAYAFAGLELGRIYTAAKEYGNAEKAINKIITFSKEQGSAYWEAKGDYYLAMLKHETGQMQEASGLLTEAHQLADEIGAQSLAEDIAEATARFSEQKP